MTTTLFADDFSGSGNFDGHAPDTKLGTHDWVDQSGGTSLELIGGFVVPTDPTIGTSGSADTGDLSATFVTPINEVTVSFSMVTGADVSPASGRFGILLQVKVNGGYFSVSVTSSATDWYVGAMSASAIVTLAPSTTYNGTLYILNGDVILNFCGETLIDNTPYVDATGLDYISLVLGDVFKAGPIGIEGQQINAELYIPMLTTEGYGGGSAALFLPTLALSASGAGPTKRGNAALTLPMLAIYGCGGSAIQLEAPALTLAAYGGAASHTVLPALTLSATAHNSLGENGISAIAPSLTLSAYGGGNASMALPMLSLSIEGTVQGLGQSETTLPLLTLSASGTVAGTAASALTMPTPTMIGYSGAVCSITLASGLTIEAAGTIGSVGNAAVTLPMFELAASATAQNYGSADLLLPSLQPGVTAQAWMALPGLKLTAIGTATITATYEAYALNLNHVGVRQGESVTDEMTRYTEFPFTHVVRYRNSYYGVAAGGLYLLEGTTDAGDEIAYAVQTAKTDFGTSGKKTVVSAYMGGRIGAEETVSLIAGDKTPVAYEYATPRGVLAQNHRQKFGRGIKDRYYAIGVAGTEEFELETLDLEINELTRSI